jgi:putative transposase
MNKASHSIALMCRVYNVTRDGYNAWRRRGDSARRLEDSEPFERIHRLFKRHDGCYGSPKITRELRKSIRGQVLT